MRVRLRHLNQGHIEVNFLQPEKRWDLAEEDRCKVCETFIDSIPHVWTDKESVVAEILKTFSCSVRGRTESQNVNDLHIV